jgi:uncharacterized protein YutE (UPF0331/DUF86 family)/predicted nucleotidyltransferase
MSGSRFSIKNSRRVSLKKKSMDEKIKTNQLADYFQKRDDVLMAFVFGSRAKGTSRDVSDWDIAVYLMPDAPYEIELETNHIYNSNHEIWRDVERITGASTDLLILNSARPQLVFTILNTGIPLIIKNRYIYLQLLIKTQYEAIDFWNFVQDFWRVRQRSQSLSPEDRANLTELLVFIENEWSDFTQFAQMKQSEYVAHRDNKRNMERWVENLVMASLDISKIILASEKKDVPHTYQDTLRSIGLLFFDDAFAETFASCAEMRNMVAHEYLDLRWRRIQQFITTAQTVYPRFIEKIQKYLNEKK